MNKLDAPHKTGITDKLAYPGMALAFLATAPEAEGQIAYTDLDPDVAVSFSTYSVDINNDGTGELDITRTEFGSMHYVGITHQAAGVSVLGLYYSNAMFPDQLQNGDPIAEGDPDWRNDATGWLVSFYSYGQWVFGDPHGFLGVRFQSGADTLYAWIELEMGYNTSYVQGYAYETEPGKSINAGDMGLVTGLAGRETWGSGISLSPVPASAQLTINGIGASAELRILTMTGQEVDGVRPGRPDATGQLTVEIGALPPGTYAVEVRDAGHVETRRFIKQ